MEREVPEEEGERRRLAITSLEPQVDQLRESMDNTSSYLLNGGETESQAHTHTHVHPPHFSHDYDGTATHVHVHVHVTKTRVCCVNYYCSKALIMVVVSSRCRQPFVR